MKKKKEADNDLIYETDEQTPLKNITKDNAKLKEAIIKSKEYLDGWQRARAELVNYRKEASEMINTARDRGQEDIIISLFPSLDAFDMAMTGEAWEGVDPVWRSGVEHIFRQLLQVLEENGVEEINEVGVHFDPKIHEVANMSGNTTSGNVKNITKRGYKKNGKVLRPAMVELE